MSHLLEDCFQADFRRSLGPHRHKGNRFSAMPGNSCGHMGIALRKQASTLDLPLKFMAKTRSPKPQPAKCGEATAGVVELVDAPDSKSGLSTLRRRVANRHKST
jgi:hypothetical protein